MADEISINLAGLKLFPDGDPISMGFDGVCNVAIIFCQNPRLGKI